MAEDLEESKSKKIDLSQLQPLEIVFSGALATVASALTNPTYRAVAAGIAPLLGYTLAKLGRWVVTFWVPYWLAPPPPPPDTAESRAQVYLADLRKELKEGGLTETEKQQKRLHIQQFTQALHERRLADLQSQPTPPPPLPPPAPPLP